MANVRVGDIILNDYVREESPLRYQVVIGYKTINKQNCVECLTLDCRKSNYRKSDIGEELIVVGHFDIKNAIKDTINAEFQKALEAEKALKERIENGTQS